MIVVTGATGRLGSQIVEHLRADPRRGAGGQRAGTPPAPAPSPRGLSGVRAGDFTEPDTLGLPSRERTRCSWSPPRSAATAAVPTVSPSTPPSPPGRSASSTPATRPAAADSLFAAQPVHAATESHLAGLGVPFTALRNGFYAGSLGLFVGDALTTGRLAAGRRARCPGRRTPTSPRLAIALADRSTLGGTGHGPTPPLTPHGPWTSPTWPGCSPRSPHRDRTASWSTTDDWRATAIAAACPRGGGGLSPSASTAPPAAREFDVTDPTPAPHAGSRAPRRPRRARGAGRGR